MAAKVFISCGQSSQEERDVSIALEQFFRSKGFDPYVAIQARTITDLNAGIIRALKASDYYLFVNFAREHVTGTKKNFRRGSLYSHQELAIAYALGFDHLLLINDKEVDDEGMQSFIVSNISRFSSFAEIPPLVEDAVCDAGWTPKYSRHLKIDSVYSPGTYQYCDHTTVHLQNGRPQKHFLGRICNLRSDTGAFHTVVRLNGYRASGDTDLIASHDLSDLKASYRIGYHHTIFPLSNESFDLFSLHILDPGKLFLNSSLDFPQRAPIITHVGDYVLSYSAFSVGFPVFDFDVLVRLRQRVEYTVAEVIR